MTSHGDSDVQEIKENNPSKVESAQLAKDKNLLRVQSIAHNFPFRVTQNFSDIKTVNGWYYSTGPEKLSIQRILDTFTYTSNSSWCSIQ